MPNAFIAAAAVLLSVFQLPRAAQADQHAARLGDVQVTVTAARIASRQDITDYGLQSRAGYNVALVFVRVKDVARYPACAFPDEWMVVKEGYVYPSLGGFSLKAPQMNGLLPTDESSGVFAFEIKAGMEPATLKLVRGLAEDACALTQHRETSISGPESVIISLSGLPASIGPTVSARAQPVPSPAPTPPQSLAAGGSNGPLSHPAGPDSNGGESNRLEPITIDGTPVFRAGQKGIGYPSCLYCPEPQNTEDARKANFQGIVVLQIIVQADGHATNIQVVKGAGLGLDEKAIEAVRAWRFKPAVGPDGRPVATITPINVNFRLL